MQTHGNTLYIQTQGACLGKDGETVRVKVDGAVKLAVPLHHLDGIVCFGRVSVSTSLIAACSSHDLSISFLTEHGRYQSRVVPAISGNVLLRRQQYRLADQPDACLKTARAMIAAKIQNGRMLLLRAGRETAGREASSRETTNRETGVEAASRRLETCKAASADPAGGETASREGDDAARGDALRHATDRLACSVDAVAKAQDLDVLRGCEGEAARVYFGAFSLMIRHNTETFFMKERTRRPPLDPLNSLLSFVYAILTHDMAGALESVGLDPAVGFLHVDRPGRLSLALDLLEEFRALFADRLVLSLINLKQVRPDGFVTQPGGAVQMDDKTRRAVLTAITQRKREEVTHPLLNEKVTIGLLPHIQARLLARHLRGDIAEYPALVLK